MKRLVTIILIFSPIQIFAEWSYYEASIDLEVGEVSVFLSSLNEQLDLKLDDNVFADYAESLAVGHVYSLNFDMHHGGAVFGAKYQVAKPEAGRVELSFTSSQKRAAQAICRQMAEFSRASDSEHSPKSCQYDRPEEFKI